MTDFKVGDRVRVAVDVLPEGGPKMPQGAEGTVTEGNHRHPKFPNVGEFVGVEFDKGAHANGDMLARRLEKIEPKPAPMTFHVSSPGDRDAVREAAESAIAQSRSEGLLFEAGATAPEDPSEAGSGFSVASRGRVYVSGPMTGLPEYNFPAFNAEAARLRADGWEVENPADKGIVDGWGWEEYLRYDVEVIARCTAIYTLPDWHTSPGANLEMIVARALGIEWLNPDGYAPSMEVVCERVPSLSGPHASIRNGGEVRVTSETGGQKGSKPARFDLIPAMPLWTVAELYGRGAEKYESRNWERGYPWHLSFAALMRHAWAFWDGEDNDAETGKPHMASVVFHAFALIEFMTTHREFDDRPTSVSAQAITT